jgi:hypothetical protein
MPVQENLLSSGGISKDKHHLIKWSPLSISGIKVSVYTITEMLSSAFGIQQDKKNLGQL